MSNDSSPRSSGNIVRWIVTGVLVVIAVAITVASFRAQANDGDRLGALFVSFLGLDFLALIGLAVWILRPPAPGATHLLGRWAGKVFLLLGLWVATVVFLFVTCLQVG